jgi:hypothetical protein
MAAYALHRAIFYQSANVIILSKGEAEAGEVLDYCRFMLSHLPPFLQLDTNRDQRSLMSFPTLSSKIRALPATEEAGIGFGAATLLILDENDFHPYAEQNYVEIKPMIEGKGKQLVILSAPNRTKINSSFKNIWHGARKGNNNFSPIFLPYSVVPGRDEAWYDRVAKDYSQKDMETRYPRTETEALSVTVAERFFDIPALSEIAEKHVRTPLKEVEGFDTRNGMIKIFQPSVKGEFYIGYTDPSMGREDPSHTVFINARTKEQVCCCSFWLPADEVAMIHDSLVHYYNKAYNSYEYNAYAGGVFKNTIQQLATPNQAPRRRPNTNDDIIANEYGVYMSPQMKKKMLGILRQNIEKKLIIIHDIATIDEMMTMMWLAGEEMPRVPEKLHDDKIMAWAGVVYLEKFAPKVEHTMRSFDYRRD